MPTIVEATWVPWPLTSVMASPGTKLAVPSIWDSRSGWCRSMPVSSTATFTPLPSNPAAHASGAPICGTLSLRLTCTLPSSHSLATPPRRVGVASVGSSLRCDGRPERAGARLRRLQRGAVDGRELAHHRAALRRRRGARGAGGGAGVGGDHRHAAGAGVVVPHLDQVRHVEQAAVELVGAEQAHGLVGHDVQVTCRLLHADAADGAGGAVDVGDLAAVGGGRDGDDVAGDQGDAMRRRGVGRDGRTLREGGPLGGGPGRDRLQGADRERDGRGGGDQGQVPAPDAGNERERGHDPGVYRPATAPEKGCRRRGSAMARLRRSGAHRPRFSRRRPRRAAWSASRARRSPCRRACTSCGTSRCAPARTRRACGSSATR